MTKPGLLVLLLLVVPGSSIAGETVHPCYPSSCVDGPVRAPTGPFAVWVFCEFAHGTHIGLVYAGHMAGPIDGEWAISDRFWQERDWASDVQSFAWSSNGRFLFVSTGAVYGTSTLYQLDLRGRKAHSLSGPHGDRAVEIVSIAEGEVHIRLRDIEKDDAIERSVPILSNESR